MTKEELEPFRFPIGRFYYDPTDFDNQKDNRIKTIEETPAKYRALAEQMTEEQMNTPYRPEGWTARQVIHHVADSHMNSYIRFKLALTENIPIVKSYKEAAWAKLPDTFETPVEVSLQLLGTLHTRWSILLRNMTDEQWNKQVGHPDWKQDLDMKFLLAMYEWHCRHHLGHLEISNNQ